ncbi:hypothetical protein Tco_0640317 [Tanacetum coccineum]
MVEGEKPPKDKGTKGGSSTENYKVWSAVVQLALHTRNKSGFSLVVRLMQFLMGLDDVFHSVRSIILIIEPIPDVKFAFTTLSRDESYKNGHSSSKSVKSRPSAFVARPSNGASQHITFCFTFLYDIINVTYLNLTIAHPNGTVEQVKEIRNYKLGNNLIVKDVLVVPGYHVSLLSVHKLSKDNKAVVSFTDSICKI